jgi:transcriptional regulator with XRE-family HTH domain
VAVTAGVTSVQQARQALGLRLRELRRQSGLTGRELAGQLGWPASKISKLENGRQTPTDSDLRVWANATGAEKVVAELVASLHTLESQHAEWRRQLRGGLRSHQVELARLDEKTKLFRAFESTFIPGLLQTAEYARARFTQSIRVLKVPNDVDEAVRVRLQRQEILYRSDKRFHFLLTEAVLRYRLCPVEVMLAQLDRLVALSAMRNVRLGIIPFETPYSVAPAHGFWLLDEDLVIVETFSAELNLAQPPEIALYSAIFDRLAAIASYGRDARAVIVRVMEEVGGAAARDGDPR